MNQVITSIVIARTEGGSTQACVRVTLETNGYAIWHDPIHADARLIAWHGFSPNTNAAGVQACALLEAQRIAREAIDHGIQFSANRGFVQR